MLLLKVFFIKKKTTEILNDAPRVKKLCYMTNAFCIELWSSLCSSVDQDLGFYDKYLFYRFLDDEEEDTPLPSEEEKRESEEELPETILFLAQIGPDALLRMILRKP